MNEKDEYSYTRENEINQHLKCLFCSKPYIDPVRTDDNIQGCRRCILSQTKSRNLVEIHDEYLLERLNNLPVQCLKCHEDNLRRSQFDEHRLNQCPKRMVSCPTGTRQSSYTGSLEVRADHVQSGTLKSNVDYEKLRQEKFESQSKQLTDLFEKQFDKNQQLEQEIQLLKKLLSQQMKMITQLQNELKQYEQMKTQIESLSNQLQRHTDLSSIKQTVDQHEIQMKLLVRKPTIVPATTSYSDPKIEQLIDQSFVNTELYLDNQYLENQAITIVSKKGILERKCSKLSLENNKITGRGATIIANSLYNNHYLTELRLSNNRVSDIGMHAFAQILSIENSTLKILELDSNEITDEGVEYLTEMLKVNRTLGRLGLGSNQISNTGVECIANALIYSNPTLQWLSLASNRLITDESYSIIRQMLVNSPGLKTLCIDECSLSTKTAELLKQANENFDLKI